MSLPQMGETSNESVAPKACKPRWARIVGRVVCRLLWKVEVHGTHNVPQTGKSIVCGNHTGFIDGPLLIGETPRPTHFLVKGAFFSGPLGVVMRAAGQIPVLRGQGKQSLIQGRAVLARQGSLGIFPEGTRGKGDLAHLHPGVGWLSLHAQAPVIPVAILGSRRTGASVHALPKLRSRVVVVFGTPVAPTSMLDEKDITKEDIALMVTHVQTAMKNLLKDSSEKYQIELPADAGTADHTDSNV